ncbi:MAG: aminomethyl-transferring glycine dehydrogenase subunit GcvPA [Eubacteriaceae bacterium]|nr:aminomethyl-transferring glycine dehydrogenase subunit GcvPA [Eubacteriaceae bacterium]
MGSYLPHSESDYKQLLAGAGYESIDGLFSSVPESLRLKEPLALPNGISEQEALAMFKNMAAMNSPTAELACFLGAGTYDRIIPTAVGAIASRSEFYTAYTPYQPEISQGTLSYIFEFQSMAAELLGLEVANASLYDGPSALAEAVMLACRAKKRKAVLLSQAISPEAKRTVETYAHFSGITVSYMGLDGGISCVPDKGELGEYAAIAAASPNFYGIIENIEEIAQAAHSAGALMIGYSENPHAMAVLKSFGSCGCDIGVAEMQGFGIEPYFGGPHLGVMASTKALMRSLPGRLAGASLDADGNRAFILTLQAREQHIRREKATSNICTNQSLNALKAVCYMSLLGPDGIREAARQGMAKLRLFISLLEPSGITLKHKSAAFFDEAVLELPVPASEALESLLSLGFIGGYSLGGGDLLVCATEKRTEAEIQAFAKALIEVCK